MNTICQNLNSRLKLIGALSVLLLSHSFPLLSQSERTIKLSGDYYWGEAHDHSDLLAKKGALQDLMFKIQVTVNAKLTSEITEENMDFQEKTNSVVSTFSSITLSGIEYMINENKDIYTAIAYISKENYQKSIDKISLEVIELIRLSEKQELENGIDKAIQNYYIAYLKTFLCPEPIFYKSQIDNIVYRNIQPFLYSKIEAFLDELTIEPENPRIDASVGMVTIPIKVNYHSKPVNDLLVNIRNEARQTIINGNAELFLYSLPSSAEVNHHIAIELKLDENYANNVIVDLSKTQRIIKQKNITIDFRDVIEINFNVEKQMSDALKFKPVYRNLSISDFFWDFGDNSTSHEQSPAHYYKNDEFYFVTLTLNQSQQLSVTKKVSANADIFPSKNQIFANETQQPDITKQTNKEIIDPLLHEKNYSDLIKKLTILKKQGKLMFGKKSVFIKPSNCYIFIVEPQKKLIIAVLDKGSNARKNLLTQEIISDLNTQYKGMIPIYVEVSL